MRWSLLPETCVLGALTAIFLAALVYLAGPDARAGELAKEGPGCTCPKESDKSARERVSAALLDESDEIAALESVQLGLSSMDDGTAFVWRRDNGRLSGIVRPTASFRSYDGQLCRHVIVLLTTGFKTRTTEGVACRMGTGRWQLNG